MSLDCSEFRLDGERPAGLFQQVVEIIAREYRVKTDKRCPWDSACGRNLKGAIHRLRDWTLADFERAVRNKFQSEENHSLSPKVWLARIEDYLTAPLDRYRVPAAITEEIPPRGLSAGAEAQTMVLPEKVKARNEADRRERLRAAARRRVRDFARCPLEAWEAGEDYAAGRAIVDV